MRQRRNPKRAKRTRVVFDAPKETPQQRREREEALVAEQDRRDREYLQRGGQ